MKRTITSVVRISHRTNSGFEINPPLRVVSLCGCVHHEVSNEPVGAEIECKACGDVEAQVARVKAFIASPEFSHVTERSSAMNGERSWTSFCFYRYDETSPTKCILEFKTSCCDEVAKAIAECGQSALPGPTRGAFAKM